MLQHLSDSPKAKMAVESGRIQELEHQIKAKDEDLSQLQSDLRVANYTIEQLETEIATMSKAGLGAGSHATPHKKKKKGKKKKRSEGKTAGLSTDKPDGAAASDAEEVSRKKSPPPEPIHNTCLGSRRRPYNL
jgi:chromosome segregation ATPase